MSLVIKGFISMKNKISNVPGSIDSLGELPTYCMTFTKELGMYNVGESNDSKLYTLYSRDENNVETELPYNIQEDIMSIYTTIKNYCRSAIKPIKKDELLVYVRNDLGLVAKDISVGKFITSGNDELPAWISWESLTLDYKCKIWLSGEVLMYDYDEYEITVITPVEDLNVFFKGLSMIEDALSKRPVSTMMEIAQEAKNLHPETITKILTYRWEDNNGNIKDTSWVVLIYGAAGDTTENIKDAINDYCIANSDYDRSEWLSHFKDLFSRTEFVLLPRFDIYSIPALYTEEGMYRSIINLQECTEYCLDKLTFYAADHVRSSLSIIPYDYKGIVICAVAGDTNVEGRRTIQEVLPDYIPLSSTSTDFLRMREDTRSWILAVEEMLRLSETLDEYTDIPRGYRKVKRGNNLYLSRNINNVYYLMLSGKTNI